jgi:hypothetical protein
VKIAAERIIMSKGEKVEKVKGKCMRGKRKCTGEADRKREW